MLKYGEAKEIFLLSVKSLALQLREEIQRGAPLKKESGVFINTNINSPTD
jgi:hypothetical protein